jgi:membrane-associated phospholipid phosphatase
VGRVLLWVHFPIDVIVGGVIGAGVSFLLAELLHTRKRRLGKPAI